MIEQLKAKEVALGWTSVEHMVMDATELTGWPDSTYDAIIMNFGLFALPQAGLAVAEMRRVLRPGGVVIITTWKYSAPIEVLENAVKEVRPEHVDRVSPISKQWLTREHLQATLLEGGFNLGSIQIDSDATFWKNDSVEGFVDALDGPFWQKIKTGWSQEDIAKWRPALRKFAGDPREDGSIHKEMIAWVGVAKEDSE